MKDAPSHSTMPKDDAAGMDRIVTIPNLICLFRLVGSGGLFLLAMAGWRYYFVVFFLLLSLSDWIDGKLARWLNQRSDLGARLDSWADAAMYAGLLGGAWFLSRHVLQQEAVWLAIGLGSYALTSGFGIWKFRRVPSYHTYGAKITQWIALTAGIFLILEWSTWPLRIAAIAVAITNLEATAISLVLKEWRADVLTLFHVWPYDRKIKPRGER